MPSWFNFVWISPYLQLLKAVLSIRTEAEYFSVVFNFGLFCSNGNLLLWMILQIFALFLRPKKEHKYRFYWNIYHHTLGYAILILSILNVFKGLDILNPAKHWRSTYIIVIISLGAIALLLEAITWVVVLKRRSTKSTKPYGFTNAQGWAAS